MARKASDRKESTKTPSTRQPFSKPAPAPKTSSSPNKTTYKSFEEFARASHREAFDKPSKTTSSSSVTRLPHEPGSLSKGQTGATARENNQRAIEAPSSGEVIGSDPNTGESLVRQPGNRVVRVDAGPASSGNTVSVNSRSTGKVVKKTGNVTKTTSTTSSGWQPVPGKPGASRLTATSSRKVDTDSLNDPCVSPSVKLQIVNEELAKGVNIGLVNGRAQIVGLGRVGGYGSSTNLEKTFAYLDQLANESKAAKGTSQSLPEAISSSPSTQGQVFSSTLAPLWKCVNDECVQAIDGIFATKEQCQQNCGPKTFNCLNGQCVEVQGSTGQFKSLADCIASNCGTRFDCVDGVPVPNKEGKYPSQEAAIEAGCYWGYSCNGLGVCTPAVGGEFKSLHCCRVGCEDVSEGTVIAVIKDELEGHPNRGAYFSINGSTTQRYFDPSAFYVDISDARAVNLAQPVQIVGDLRAFDAQRIPQGKPGIRHRASVVFLTPQIKRLTISLTGIQMRFPLDVLNVSPPTNDAELDNLLKNMKWVQYVIQPEKQVGPIQEIFVYTSRSKLNPNQPFDPDLPDDLRALRFNPMGIVDNHNMHRKSKWTSNFLFQLGGYNSGYIRDPLLGAFDIGGSRKYTPTTFFSKYTNWSIDNTQIPNEIVVNYPDTTWVDPEDDMGPFHPNFYMENWADDFRAFAINVGAVISYPPLPEDVDAPGDFVPHSGQNSEEAARGYSFYPPHRCYFTVAVQYGDDLPGF